MELLVDYRWLQACQGDTLRTDLTVNDLNILVGTAARRRVDPPRLDQNTPTPAGAPPCFWRNACSCAPARTQRGVRLRTGVAYLEAAGTHVDISYGP